MEIIDQWLEAPKKAAAKLLDHYMQRNEPTPTKLSWYARMEVTASEALHKAPRPIDSSLSTSTTRSRPRGLRSWWSRRQRGHPPAGQCPL